MQIKADLEKWAKAGLIFDMLNSSVDVGTVDMRYLEIGAVEYVWMREADGKVFTDTYAVSCAILDLALWDVLGGTILHQWGVG